MSENLLQRAFTRNQIAGKQFAAVAMAASVADDDESKAASTPPLAFCFKDGERERRKRPSFNKSLISTILKNRAKWFSAGSFLGLASKCAHG